MSPFTSTVAPLGGSMKRDPPYGLQGAPPTRARGVVFLLVWEGRPGAKLFASNLPDELRFQLHRTDAVYLAVDIVVAVDQADVLDLGTDLDHQR